MAEERVQRRLAAILAADVVSYSRLMEQDEAGTLAALKSRRKAVLEPLVARHQGRIFKTTGDGVLVEFASALNAVQCATDLQQGMADANGDRPEDRHIVLRIGVNLGDVMVEGGDLYGDGVNIAARLESLAEPGGILVSAKVREEVGRKLDLAFDDRGELRLKNIDAPIRAFGVRAGTSSQASGPAPPSLPAKPSIAVLPFTNMSGDPEQRYFSDGITEDIITELSRFHSLFVIARNSSFQYRDKAVDAKQIGRELGVGFVVEGSVRRSGTRLRITAQLIEAATGNHVWAERYDREIEDIFVVQDEVVQSVVAILPARIAEAGARSARRKRPENLVAYDYLLRGADLCLSFDDTQSQPAREMLEKAIALDATIAPAYSWLALLQLRDWWTKRSEPALDEAFLLARKAASTDGNDAEGHQMLGMVYLERRQFDQAAFHVERCMTLNPNDATSVLLKGSLLAYVGRPLEAIVWAEKAFRLNPLAPPAYNSFYGMILFAARRYADSIAAFKRILVPHGLHWECMYLVAAHAYIDQLDEANRLIGKFKTPNPGMSLMAFAAREPFKNQADLDHLLKGLRKAGLPD